MLDFVDNPLRDKLLSYGFIKDYLERKISKEIFLKNLNSFLPQLKENGITSEDLTLILDIEALWPSEFSYLWRFWGDMLIRIDEQLSNLFPKNLWESFWQTRKATKIDPHGFVSYFPLEKYDLIIALDKEGRLTYYVLNIFAKIKYNYKKIPPFFIINHHQFLGNYKYRESILHKLIEEQQKEMSKLLNQGKKRVLVIDGSSTGLSLDTASTVCEALISCYPNNIYNAFALSDTTKLFSSPLDTGVIDMISKKNKVKNIDYVENEKGIIIPKKSERYGVALEYKEEWLEQKPTILSTVDRTTVNKASKFRKWLILRIKYYIRFGHIRK